MAVTHKVDSIKEHNAEVQAEDERRASIEDLLGATAELGDLVAELMDGVAELGDIVSAK